MWNFGDGFDFWNGNSDPTLGTSQANWDTFTENDGMTGASGTANTRFGSGQACGLYYTGSMSKSVSNNDPTHHIVFAYRRPTGSATTCVVSFGLYDGTGCQCTISLHMDGSIRLYSGNATPSSGSGAVPNGTLLATAALNMAANIWYGIEMEISISATAGYLNIRLNGNNANDYTSATNLNTRNGTSNAYANKIVITDHGGAYASSNPNRAYIDDFLWFTTAGAAPNTWVGDIRAVQLMPTADASVTMFPTPGVTSYLAGTSYQTATLPASTLFGSSKVTTTGNCTVTSLSVIFSSAFTGHWKLALYDWSGANPGTLLGQTAEQTNAVAGTLTVNLITPVVLASGAAVCMMMLTDGSASIRMDNTSTHVNNSNTYSTGFPSPNTYATTSGYAGLYGVINVSPANFSSINQAIEDGDTSYVSSSTVGNIDYYNIASLAATPANVIGVQTKMLSKKTDAGTRQARINTKSSGTVSNGGTLTLGTSYLYTSKLDLVDPNTSLAFTGSGVNSLQIGMEVVA